ncbi:MAG TPA: glycosyltransferase [Gemmatimonadaceae bacterium]|nr:glycosyltransferase [Gemmatimonadaceae bacterium]
MSQAPEQEGVDASPAYARTAGTVRFTVAICTWNRCHLLAQTLERMTRLVIPPGVEWELLVVDNNSTDATPGVVHQYAARLPIRGFFEPRAGKPHALNLAVREARGDYILWTDDDVLVDPQWAVEYCRAFERWPDAALFGGRIIPWFAGTPPRWLKQVLPRVPGVYAMRDFGEEPVPLTHFLVPFGANMAVRTDVQRRYPYDASLGPSPVRTFGGEETALVRAMLAAGEQGWWIPTAAVRHYIAEHRQTTRYIRRYLTSFGESAGAHLSMPAGHTMMRRPLWLWKQTIAAEARYAVRRCTAPPRIWIEDLIHASLARGQWRAYGAGPRRA